MAARMVIDGRLGGFGAAWRVGWSRRLTGWWRRRRLERQVEAALRIEAAWLPAPRTAAERLARAEALAATRAVVLATLTRLDLDGSRSTAGGEKGP